MTENFGYVDHNNVQAFDVYVDGVYVGQVNAADAVDAMHVATDKYFVRQDQNCTIKPVSKYRD